MFDIGFTEIMVITVVALLVIGPERLPAVAYTVGRWTTRVRRWINNAKADLDAQINSSELKDLLSEQQAQINSLKQSIQETGQDIRSETLSTIDSVKTAPVPPKTLLESEGEKAEMKAIEDDIAALEAELGESISKPDFTSKNAAEARSK